MPTVNPFMPSPPRKRRGCTGCLTQVGLGLLFGLGLVYVLYAVLAPWNFYYGGRFHIVPGWTGRGRLRSSTAGGDYELYLRVLPSTPGYRKSPIQGNAVLCTPRGERFRLNFGGSLPREHGTDLNGVPIHLYLFNWPLFFPQLTADRHPRFDLYGSFRGAELVMEDRGSLSAEFSPDGTLLSPRDRNRARAKENIQVTFTESSPWDFSQPCPVRP